MFAELQMMTPMVPTREVYFVRYCKRHNPETWAVVDVSLGPGEDSMGSSLLKCRKLPSGCIIEDKASGHCKVMKLFFSSLDYHIHRWCLQWGCGCPFSR